MIFVNIGCIEQEGLRILAQHVSDHSHDIEHVDRFIAVGIAGSKTSRVLVENYAAEMALVNDPTALVNRLNLLLAAGQLSSATTVTIRDAIASIDPRSDYGQKSRVWAAILLVMSCPEYLVQK